MKNFKLVKSFKVFEYEKKCGKCQQELYPVIFESF